ncbi:MAG TPA: DUF3467 domain-containing protein [Anaerolineales bacterium]|nr:DUF3467 domain-containing protein [Anaerolineales bacterium]
MTLPPQKQPASLPIETPADLLPAYANLARIAHAPAEFVLDFARILPGDSKALVTNRIIMSPVALKLFAQAVNDNLGRYEATFGPITLPNGTSTLADTLFKPFHPPEGPQDPPKDSKK